MNYQSIAYDLVIHSTFPLFSSSSCVSEQPCAVPDVIIRQGKPGEFDIEGNGDSLIVAYMPDYAQFLFDQGRELIIWPEPGVTLESLRPVILGSSFSILLQQRGQLVLHASSVAIQGQAIAFLGNSGWGKSTLVAMLHAQGHTFITDDVLPIRLDATPPRVSPSYPEVRLLPETLTRLGDTFQLEDRPYPSLDHNSFDHHQLSEYQSSDHPSFSNDVLNANDALEESDHVPWKSEKQVTTRVAQHALPLRCLFILKGGDRHCITPIPTQQAFLELSHHSRAIRMIDDLAVEGLRRDHFRQCAALSQKIPCFYLQRRASLAELHETINLIESHLASFV